MAFWTRGRSFGTSMCNKCFYEIPYGTYSSVPDPDVCPGCGEQMENGYNTLKNKLEKEMKLHIKAVDEEVFPVVYSVSDSTKAKMYKQIFSDYIKYLNDNHGNKGEW